jgi:hypothetical protein
MPRATQEPEVFPCTPDTQEVNPETAGRQIYLNGVRERLCFRYDAVAGWLERYLLIGPALAPGESPVGRCVEREAGTDRARVERCYGVVTTEG